MKKKTVFRNPDTGRFEKKGVPEQVPTRRVVMVNGKYWRVVSEKPLVLQPWRS